MINARPNIQEIKLTSITQKPANYSEKETRKEIEDRLTEEDLSEEDKEYLTDLLDNLGESEERYLVYAHDNLPAHRDHEFVPFRKELDPMLEVVFDAFDEICRRMKDGEA